MPSLPGPEDLGGRPPAMSGRRVATIDTTAPGEGLARLGQGVEQSGEVLGRTALINARIKKAEDARAQAQADKDQAFATQSAFLKFEQQQHDNYSAATQDVQPGAAGFSDSFIGGYDENAKKFFADVPAPLKGEYDNKLLELRGTFKDATTRFQNEEKSRYAQEQIVSGQNIVLNRINSDPNSWPSADQDAENQIKNSPLTPVEQDKALVDWRQRRGEALFNIANAQNPESARAGLRNLSPTEATDAASVLRHFEGFVPDTRWDVNHYRAGYGSDTTTLADGTVVPVTKDTIVTREDAERDLARRTQEFANTASNQVGATAWDRLDGQTRAALTSVAYNYGSLPGSVEKAIRSGDKDAIASAVENLSANPARRRQEANIIRGGEVGPAPQYADIPFEQRQKLYDASLKDQQQATSSALADYTEYLRSGQAAQSGDLNGSRFQLPELTSIYGPDAQAKRDELDKAAAVGKDVASVAFATPDELNTMVQNREALLASPDGFRQNLQDANGLKAVIKQRNTLIAQDPSAYVLQEPSVNAAYQAMTQAPNDPQATANYAEATLAKQSELGVPEDAQAILPKAAQQSIVSQFKNQKEGGQNAAQLMEGLAQQWGKYWPQVFGEMAKDLPGSAMVIGSMGLESQQHGAAQLAQAAALGTDALEKALPDHTKRDIRNNVRGDNGTDSVLQDFNLTFAHSNAQGVRTLGAVQEAVYQLALSYAAQGEEGVAASQHAYDDVIGKAYTMMDTYRVPQPVDAELVQAGAQHVLQNIDATNWAIPTSLAGLPPDQTRAAYLDSVKAHGAWITSEDESGLTLWDGQKPVLTTTGQPVEMKWPALLAAGAEAIPQRAPVGAFPPNFGTEGTSTPAAPVTPPAAPTYPPAEQTPSSTPDNPTVQSMKENERAAWHDLFNSVMGRNPKAPEPPPHIRDPNNTIRRKIGEALGFIPKGSP